MGANDLNDTIAAIASSFGESGIGIVRLSGKDALSIADKVFLSKRGEKPSSFKTYTLHYGWIIDLFAEPQTNVIDEVILAVMRSPRSFTKEDVVEINCHGGIVALRRALDLVLQNGARIAQPGEFTKRAFLNGRIDLAQAEAVLNIIKAKTDYALKVGVEQLRGRLSQEINRIRQELVSVLAELEANIDFPEEEIGQINLQLFSKRLQTANKHIKEILDSANRGRVLREGISAVICGKPNVGKSSLLNALLKEERSIVTPIAGTTRDTIEEIIDIKGIPVKIVDTAGIIEPKDLVEKKAVWRSRKYIRSADLVILVFDNSKKLNRQDLLLIKKLKDKKVIAVINKMDLKSKMEKEKITRAFQQTIEISARKSKNINILEDAIADLVYGARMNIPEPLTVVNLRHIELLRKAQKPIAESLNSLDNKLSLEFIAQGIKDALRHLDELLGRGFGEDLLDKIFSEFCIGK